MANACRLRRDDVYANIDFHGDWDFCTEYDIGNVVIYHGGLFMSLCHQAGHEPLKKGSHEYWIPFGFEHTKPFDIEDIDGGYANTMRPEIYENEDLKREIDGGSSKERRHIPLV